MKVTLLDLNNDAINKMAHLGRSTRQNELEEIPHFNPLAMENTNENEEYFEWEAKNPKFVKGLLKVKHLGILEHVVYTFHVSGISRCLTHQLVRHRIASYLQMSNRHASPECCDLVRPPSIKPGTEAYGVYVTGMAEAYKKYEKLMELGIPREDARYLLPPGFFTHIAITMNARSLRHFLELRLDKHAQWEIREMACKIFDKVYARHPVIYSDLKELRENAGI